MKKSVLACALALVSVFACQPAENPEKQFETKTATEDGYTYEYVVNDPFNTRIYTLANGLKVYLSPYNVSPRVMTYIAVRAGGKYDPANATGLAHYLEHIMFKGTDRIGSKDWETEKPMLDSVERMFEHYRTLTDPNERKAFYAKIDQVSNKAAEFAIANEYDKIVSQLGAQGTNAYTTEDRTVYVNNIPANELERWLQTEADRFKMITPRLFHTELEAVYEEKNRSLDNDGWKVYETMYEAMFTGHPYGTQTVIGTVEHLKNPSITEIKNYFAKYYVPNNMAVCMSGDLDPAATIKLVDKYFGRFEKQPLEALNLTPSPGPKGMVERNVIGPDAESVSIAFMMPGSAHPDILLANLADYMFSNSEAGLLDINLKQQQKVLDPYSYLNTMNDHSMHIFGATPREGQSLEEVRDLLLAQIDSLKKGNFEDWLPSAVITNFEVSQIKQNENIFSRANAFVSAFDAQIPWEQYVSRNQRMKKITREDIVAFANKYYGENFVVVYKREGEDPNKIQIEKPEITKVALNRGQQSAFYTELMTQKPPRIQPAFLNYQQDLTETKTKSGLTVRYKKNEESGLFTMYYLLDAGSNSDPRLKVAVEYLEYLGTEGLPAEAFKKELYKLGSSFGVSAGEDRIYVYLDGLDDKMEASMELFERLLNNPVPDQDALSNMVDGILKKRQDMQKDKYSILYSGLMNYGKYGPSSPFTHQLTNKELKALKATDLTELISQITKTEHRVLYYGPRDPDNLTATLDKLHKVPASLAPVPKEREFNELDIDEAKVYWTHYPMVQAEVMAMAKSAPFDPGVAPKAQIFNEYYGGNMSSVLFQELREAKGLAYAVWGGYSTASKPGKSDYVNAYIGTQADKLDESLGSIMELMENMLESEEAFEASRESILSKIESQRIVKTSVLFNYEDALRKGLDHDLRQKVYEAVKTMGFEDLKAFHAQYIKDRKYAVTLVGDRDKLDFKTLEKYGKVQELTLDDLFPFNEREKIPAQ